MPSDTSTTKTTPRSPIVTVLGHVDHGKTTLLDAIRQSNVASREAGGITQSIGASTVTTKEGKTITFLDTPGHALFSKMRSRGAKAADIAVLVVASDDGVKPQTKEAIKYIKEENIPFIVAFTKIDMPASLVERAIADMTAESVLLDGQGGDTPYVKVSGKTGEGVPDLLEMITLISEMNDISYDADSEIEGFVIETATNKRGPVATIVLKNGTLSVGDEVYSGDLKGKVKGLFDQYGESLKGIIAGEAAQVLGFSDLPPVGSLITDNQANAHSHAQKVKPSETLEIDDTMIPVVIKSSNAGSLEAILAHVSEDLAIVSASVGEVSESDVFVAKSTAANIYVFESSVPARVKKLARTEGVKIETFDVVYKLFERFDELVDANTEEVLGAAQILSEFPFNKQRVAGSKVVSGKISKSDQLVLMRNQEEIGRTGIKSMKKEKKDVESVASGEEFGLIMSHYLDFKPGDMIVSVRR